MASILETFYILFESNSKDVKKGAEEASGATKNLDADLTATDATAAALAENMISKFGELALAVGAAFSVERLAGFITDTATLNAQLGITAERLGISVSDLDAYGQATERAGGSAEGFTQSLDFLNRGIADIATKGTSRLKPFFDELKINVTDAPHHVRPLLDILGDLADKLSGLSAQQRAGIAEKLGLDEGTVLLLAQGRRGLDDLVERSRALGVATQEDAEKAHAYKVALEDTEQQLRHTATAIGGEVLPKLAAFFKAVGDIVTYLASHRQLVEGFFIALAGIIGTVFFPTIVAAAAATLAFLAPWVLIGGAIIGAAAAIALLVDDVQNFLAGNKSVIGELSKTWPAVGETIRAAVKDGAAALQWFTSLFQSEYALTKSVVGLVVAVFDYLGGKISGAFAFISKTITTELPEWGIAFKVFGDLVSWVAGLIEGLVGWFVKLGASAIAALPKALGNLAASTDKITGVVQGKETYAQYQAEERARIKAALPGVKAVGASGVALVGPALPPGSKVAQSVASAQRAIKTADTTPLSSVNNSTVTRGRGGDKTVVFNGGPVTINAPAGTADQIAGALNRHMETQVRQAVDHFDNGVAG